MPKYSDLSEEILEDHFAKLPMKKKMAAKEIATRYFALVSDAAPGVREMFSDHELSVIWEQSPTASYAELTTEGKLGEIAKIAVRRPELRDRLQALSLAQQLALIHGIEQGVTLRKKPGKDLYGSRILL